MATIKGRRFSSQESKKATGVVGESFEVLEKRILADNGSINERATVDTEWEILEVPLSLLESFPGNRVLRLSAIPQLAQSIARTRLIHPIAIAKDYDNEGKYIVLSGHRRTEAYKLLNEQYPDGRYSKIKAILVSSRESKDIEKLKRIWLDANFETRQLSLEDVVNHIDMFLQDISSMSDDEKRITVNQLKGKQLTKEEYDSLAPRAKMVNKAEYIYQQFKDLDINEWSLTSLKTYLSIVDNGIAEVRESFLRSEMPLYIAHDISKYDKEKQVKLVEIFKKEPLEYMKNKNSYLGAKKTEKSSPLIRESNNLMKVMKNLDRVVDNLKQNPNKIDTDSRTTIKAMREYLVKMTEELDKKLIELERISKDS